MTTKPKVGSGSGRAEGKIPGSRAGLSLVEMLIVIAVAMFVLAIAAASVRGILARGEEVVSKRNAQHLLTVASVATASGNDAVTGASNLEDAVDRLIAGVRASFIQGGYRVASLSDEAKREAMEHLEFEAGRLHWSDRS